MKDNRRICPHCHKKVSLRKCTYYFLRDSNYSIECNHCHRTIKPIKNPLKVEYCVCGLFINLFTCHLLYVYFPHGFFNLHIKFTPFYSIGCGRNHGIDPEKTSVYLN